MLSARRKSDGHIVTAYFAKKEDAPFVCLDCRDEVILKNGRRIVSHFAHANPIACKFAEGESDEHRRCKIEIFKALVAQPNVSDLVLERPIGTVRPDVSGYINGVKVAIEVQISFLSIETIMRRTIDYHQRGIYVLWLLQWTSELDSGRYSPRPWERWIHAAYFGRVYYWTHGASVVSYHFDHTLKSVPQKTWYAPNGKKKVAGGFTKRLKRVRAPIRGKTFNLATDFGPKQRLWWEGNGMKVPDAKIYMENLMIKNERHSL